MTAARIALVAGTSILIAGVIVFIVGLQPPPPRTFHGSVKDLLPKTGELSGWQVQFQPIADTPEMAKNVEKILQFDDVALAVYTKGTTRFSIYIAYWAPGTKSYRLVAGHTPDICWVQAGWKCAAAMNEFRLADGLGNQVPPAELREMRVQEQSEHVAFWHLRDGVPASYGTQGNPPWYASLSDLFAQRLNQRPEQFFIRVSSPMPADGWPTLEVWRTFATKLRSARVF